MPRGGVPTDGQVLRFIELLEAREWLPMGYARTNDERNRTRLAWEEIATILNNDDSGATKTGQQWSKYWKDKKSTLKRKLGTLAVCQNKTDGVPSKAEPLTDIELRMVKLVGGPLKIMNTENQAGVELVQHSGQQDTDPLANSGTTNETSPPGSPDHCSSIESTPQRLRHRRQMRRTPPTQQRRSRLFNMTERLLAIEERRAETEHILARTQHMLAENAQTQARTNAILANIGERFLLLLEKFVDVKNNVHDE